MIISLYTPSSISTVNNQFLNHNFFLFNSVNERKIKSCNFNINNFFLSALIVFTYIPNRHKPRQFCFVYFESLYTVQ